MTLFERTYFFEARDEKIKAILVDKLGFLPQIADHMLDSWGKYALWAGNEMQRLTKQMGSEHESMAWVTSLDTSAHTLIHGISNAMPLIIKWVKASNGKINLRDYQFHDAYKASMTWEEEEKANIQKNIVSKWRQELSAGTEKDGMAKVLHPEDEIYPKGILFGNGSFWINLETNSFSEKDPNLGWILNNKNLPGNCGRDDDADTIFVYIDEAGEAQLMASFGDDSKMQRQLKASHNQRPEPEYYAVCAYLLAKVGCTMHDANGYNSDKDFTINLFLDTDPEYRKKYEEWGGYEIEENDRFDFDEAYEKYREHITDEGIDYFIDAGFDLEFFLSYVDSDAERSFMQEVADDEKSNLSLDDVHLESNIRYISNNISEDELRNYLTSKEGVELGEDHENYDFEDLCDAFLDEKGLKRLVEHYGQEEEVVSDIIDARYENMDLSEFVREFGYDLDWVRVNSQLFDVDAMVNSYIQDVDEETLRNFVGL